MDDALTFRCPEPLRSAIDLAAKREFTTSSEYARQAILARLRAAGFDPEPLP
jgi:hypothetical protein